MSDNQPEPSFDGLADDYDKVRPRYPARLFERAAEQLVGVDAPVVVDAGAGTGIALESVLPLVPSQARVIAVDISADMIRIGERKFPGVEWLLGSAEDALGSLRDVDLVIAAQSYQWMDRPSFLRATHECVAVDGTCLIVQNNRNHASGGFAAEYENLLEENSPGYTRHYRDIDIAADLRTQFAQVEIETCGWDQRLSVAEFVAMSSSSSQAQRAIAARGEVFLDSVRELCQRWASDGQVAVPYVSEAFYGIGPK